MKSPSASDPWNLFCLPTNQISRTRQLLSTDFSDLWMKGIKLVLSLLIVTILLGLAGGVIRIFFSLHTLGSLPLEHVFRQLIIDTLIILAIVEVFKTTLTYFSEGRVKVTFIVDTILVVMLTEIISKWFSETPLTQWMILGGILLTLALIRIVAVRWSPTRKDSLSDPHSLGFPREPSSES